MSEQNEQHYRIEISGEGEVRDEDGNLLNQPEPESTDEDSAA